MTACKSCGHASGHELHCAWGTPAQPTIKGTRRATIDPGSRWIAVTITDDDGPTGALRFVAAKCFEVGREIIHDPPLVKLKSRKVIEGVPVEGPLETYLVEKSRELTPKEASEAATAIVAYILANGVEEAVTEHVKDVYGGARAAATQLLRSSWVYQRVADRLTETYGIPVRYVLAATWRARLTPLVKAAMLAAGQPIAGVLIKGKGAALEPVFRGYVEGWPGGAAWPTDQVEHVRDSTGLALACHLPALPQGKRSAPGVARRRERRAGKRPPRGSRARAKMGPIDLAKYRATDRARDQRYRDRARVKSIEVRTARGCECPWSPPPLRGAHDDGCPVGEAMRVALATACTCREDPTSREGKHRATCAIRVTLDRARAAVCSCVVKAPRLGKRHRRGCPMHKPRVCPG